MSTTLEQAAARLLDLMASAAESAASALPEVVTLAGRYLQMKAISQIIVMALLLAICGVAARYAARIKCPHDRMFGFVGVGSVAILVVMIVAVELPGILPRALDHRLAIIGYVLEARR